MQIYILTKTYSNLKLQLDPLIVAQNTNINVVRPESAPPNQPSWLIVDGAEQIEPNQLDLYIRSSRPGRLGLLAEKLTNAMFVRLCEFQPAFFLPTNPNTNLLVTTIQNPGVRTFSSEVLAKPIQFSARPATRRLQVARLWAKGYGIREIADFMKISEKTVFSHQYEIYRFARITSRTELVTLFATVGF